MPSDDAPGRRLFISCAEATEADPKTTAVATAMTVAGLTEFLGESVLDMREKSPDFINVSFVEK